jgi:2-dehydro-3-deoxygalactonokinase
VLRELCGDWLAAPGAFCLISGMAGSKQGWVEAPYCACPAGPAEVARQVIEIEPARIAMAPGLSHEAGGVPDVMRGEEVQIFGAVALTGIDAGLFVLPGTHNKWARVEAGRVQGFRTFMTGEFYALLSQHSILARTLDATAELDEAAFLQGVARATEGERGSLLNHAFGARTLSLFGRRTAAELASYLSGLLIGDELRTALRLGTGAAGDAAGSPGSEIVLIGSPALTRRYALALSARGIATRMLGAKATWAGLHALARSIT